MTAGSFRNGLIRAPSQSLHTSVISSLVSFSPLGANLNQRFGDPSRPFFSTEPASSSSRRKSNRTKVRIKLIHLHPQKPTKHCGPLEKKRSKRAIRHPSSSKWKKNLKETKRSRRIFLQFTRPEFTSSTLRLRRRKLSNRYLYRTITTKRLPWIVDSYLVIKRRP